MPITSQDPQEIVTGAGTVIVDPGAMDGAEYRPPGAAESWRDPAPKPAGRKPFDTKPGYSVPVWQRASSTWSNGYFTVGTSAVQIVRMVRGRFAVTLWVPASVGGSAPNGVVIGPDPGPLEAYFVNGTLNGAGTNLLNAGDSVSIPTEAPVWAICLNGQTTGVVQFFDVFNPAVVDPTMES